MNQYEKQGIKAKYSELYHVLGIVDSVASAFNKVWNQKYEEAITDFSMIDILPLKKSDQANVKAKLFESPYLTSETRSLLLDCVIAIARLIKHIHYKISNETNRF